MHDIHIRRACSLPDASVMAGEYSVRITRSSHRTRSGSSTTYSPLLSRPSPETDGRETCGMHSSPIIIVVTSLVPLSYCDPPPPNRESAEHQSRDSKPSKSKTIPVGARVDHVHLSHQCTESESACSLGMLFQLDQFDRDDPLRRPFESAGCTRLCHGVSDRSSHRQPSNEFGAVIADFCRDVSSSPPNADGVVEERTDPALPPVRLHRLRRHRRRFPYPLRQHQLHRTIAAEEWVLCLVIQTSTELLGVFVIQLSLHL